MASSSYNALAPQFSQEKITQFAFDSLFIIILTCDNPKDAWDKIKEEFEGSDRTRSCNQMGHVEKVCKAKKVVVEEKTAIVENEDENEELLFMARTDADPLSNNIWLIDNGCSNHLSIGTVSVETPKGVKYITGVHYIPEVDQNLLSVGKLTRSHYALLFEDQYYTIHDPTGAEMITVEMKNNCYPLNLMNANQVAFYCEMDTSELWHKRLGHVNYGSLAKMATDDLVEGLPAIKNPDKVGDISGNKLAKEDGFGQADVVTYRSMVGSLLYLLATRPDIMYSTSLLSRFMQAPSTLHFIAVKRIIKNVKGTLNYGLRYEKNENSELHGYSDSDWAGSLEDSKSTRGFCLSFGSGVFCWNNKKQEVVAQFSTEAEYIATAAATNHVVWLRKLLNDLGFKQEKATLIHVDNKSAIAIAKNPGQHGRAKHIRVKHHAIRELVKELSYTACRHFHKRIAQRKLSF
ncbi:Uncharacterized protein TCM_042900 [Theobroma cacao]|uniref:Uncharacterized protein n=1 Tax=Theobroma cacao TaxID=3641 RepID=A0A061FNQ3_THECC|nr:Uncharacterized protein TCM_042900 [Theobroma cacao]